MCERGMSARPSRRVCPNRALIHCGLPARSGPRRAPVQSRCHCGLRWPELAATRAQAPTRGAHGRPSVLAQTNSTEACLVGLPSPTLAEQTEDLVLYHRDSPTCLRSSRAHVPQCAQRAGPCNPAVVFVDLLDAGTGTHSSQRVVVGPLKSLRPSKVNLQVCKNASYGSN